MEWLQYAAQYGLPAILFIWLLIDTQKKNSEREDRYIALLTKNQETLNTFCNGFCEHTNNRLDKLETTVEIIERRG